MESNFQSLLELFVELGGIADNICLREGALGRGIFPVDSLRQAKIMTPKKLLIDPSNVCICNNEIYIKGASHLSSKEKEFIQLNYNYAWQGGGSVCAAEFLKYVSTIPESVKSQLLGCGFIDKAFLNNFPDENGVWKRFVDERVVRFGDKSVLASVWDLVNHSSFSPPFRITPYGVETPPIEPSSEEILHKYSGTNSPIGMWKKYGFACECILAYSIPFNIDLGNQALTIKCAGQLGLGPNKKIIFSVSGDILSFKSLPVGCLSPGLPRENFGSILSSVGLSANVVDGLFSKICGANLKARRDLIVCMQRAGSGAGAELYKALMHEIELIENASNYI